MSSAPECPTDKSGLGPAAVLLYTLAICERGCAPSEIRLDLVVVRCPTKAVSKMRAISDAAATLIALGSPALPHSTSEPLRLWRFRQGYSSPRWRALPATP